MDSLVKSRPNHYELLGLTPAATDEDIRRAFAREISPLRPRPFGSLAQLGVAHETLRDPVKRRAYDISIGLPEPAKPAPLAGWQYSGPVRVSRLSQAAADSQVATEPKAVSRESAHGGSAATDAEIDAWIDEAMAGGDDVGIETPVGTTGVSAGFNPDTAEPGLQQPLTEPLLDPATAKAIRKETETLRKAADPDKG